MIKEERNNHILIRVKDKGRVTIAELSNELSVSEDTIRRDIDALNRSGMLVKVRGGAISPKLNPLTFQERVPLYSKAKDIIALKAIRAIKDEQVIFMDGGTTTVAIVQKIPKNINLTIITTNSEIIPWLDQHELVTLIIIGGTYNKITKTNVGIQSCREIQKYQADLYFMGACAIDASKGVKADVKEDGEVKQVFLANANKTMVLGNSEKIGKSSFYKICDVYEVDGFITDLDSDDARLDFFRKLNLEIL